MSEGQAGTETRRWTIKGYHGAGPLGNSIARMRPLSGPELKEGEVVEVVEASDPEGTARDLNEAVTALENIHAELLAKPAPYIVRAIACDVVNVLNGIRALAASGGTRPAFTDEGEALYRVEVEGGGSFLYDEVDVGRFAKRMATEGDTRAFSVAPAPSTSIGRPDDA